MEKLKIWRDYRHHYACCDKETFFSMHSEAYALVFLEIHEEMVRGY